MLHLILVESWPCPTCRVLTSWVTVTQWHTSGYLATDRCSARFWPSASHMVWEGRHTRGSKKSATDPMSIISPATTWLYDVPLLQGRMKWRQWRQCCISDDWRRCCGSVSSDLIDFGAENEAEWSISPVTSRSLPSIVLKDRHKCAGERPFCVTQFIQYFFLLQYNCNRWRAWHQPTVIGRQNCDCVGSVVHGDNIRCILYGSHYQTMGHGDQVDVAQFALERNDQRYHARRYHKR